MHRVAGQNSRLLVVAVPVIAVPLEFRSAVFGVYVAVYVVVRVLTDPESVPSVIVSLFVAAVQVMVEFVNVTLDDTKFVVPRLTVPNCSAQVDDAIRRSSLPVLDPLSTIVTVALARLWFVAFPDQVEQIVETLSCDP